MANTLAFTINADRDDREVGENEASILVAATDTATAAPDGDTAYVATSATQPSDAIRAYVRYTGEVTAASIVLWVLQDGAWYRAGTETLDPEGGNEIRDLVLLGRQTKFTIQLATIEGGGTAEIRVLGVW